MVDAVHILILEDNPADAELIQFELEEAGILFIAKVVMTEEGFIHELQAFSPDIILSDYDLPKYNGVLALAEAKRRCPDIPFILVTGAVIEDRAIDILTQGAKDYVMKTRLQQRLAPAVQRALAEAEVQRARKQAEADLREAHRTLEERVKIRTAELQAEIEARKKTEEALHESERRERHRAEELATILDAVPTSVIIVHDPDSMHMTCNRTADELLKQPRYAEVSLSAPTEAKPTHFRAFKDGRELRLDELPAQRAARGEHVKDFEFSLVFTDGTTRHLLGYGTPLLNEQGQPRGAVHVLVDITERKLVEEERRKNQETAERLAEEMAIIAEIGRVVSSTLNIGEVYEQFTAEVRKLITCDRISVDLNNPAEETFTITYVWGFDIPNRRPGDIIPLKGSISEVILRTRTGLLVHPTSIEDVTSLFPSATNISTVRAGMHSLISVPLISRDEVIGTLHLRAKERNAYTEQDLRLAERIGAQIAGAIANAQLFKDLQNTETSLRDSEARLQSILDNSGIVVFLKDLDGRYITVNRRFEELFQVTRQTVVGKSDRDLFSQEYADKFRQHDLVALEKGAPFETEEIVPQGGSLRTYISAKFPLFRVDGKPYAVCGIATDITERKRAEQEIAILAEIGRLISSTPDIDEVYERFATEVRKFIPCDRLSVNLQKPHEDTFSIAYVSGLDIPERRPGAKVPKAGSLSEVVARTRTGLLIHPESADEMMRLFPNATAMTTVRAGMQSIMGVPLISRDEVIGTLQFRAKKPNAYTERDLRLAERIGMQIAGAIANTQLFNDLSKTEKSLRESNELFSLFMRHSPIYAYIKEVTSAQSRVLQASENFGEMIGIPDSPMTGKTMAELFPPECAAKIAADDWAVVSDGKVLTQDEEFNGRSYTTIKFPIILGDKTLLAGYSIDITERKRTEAELLRVQKLESLGVLAGGIAHDFNNLMTVVQGHIGLVLMDLPREHPSHERLRAAMRSVENTKELTSRFITFSRGGGPALEPLDVREIIRDAVCRTVKKTKTRVKFDFVEDLRSPEIDEHQIKQCFYNLATNAVEAMPEGGNLTIRAENVDIPKGNPLPVKAGSYIKITFADKGPGIPEEHLVKIFDPYFTTKKIGLRKGLGLGLSVCYFVLKQHSGHITVESRPGKGASFSLYLPA